MKTIIIKSLLFSALVLLAPACTQDFEKLNTPPTTFPTVDPALVLAKAQKDAAFFEGMEYFANCQFGSWAQHWASGVLISPARYIQQPDDEVWRAHYDWIKNLAQIRLVLLKGKEADPKGRTKLAIARIVEISIWQRLTDLFGDVPFFEGVLAVEQVNNQPKFDTQEAVYKALIADLNTAISQLTPTDDKYGAGDFYYKGDVDKWKKYGNSLKLRLGMRLRYADAALAQKVVTEAMGQPLIESNADNAMIPTFNGQNVINTYPVLNQKITGSPDLKYLASALVNQLVSTNDPRLTGLVQPTANSVKAGKKEYRGMGVALTDDGLKKIIKDDYSTPSSATFFKNDYSPAIPCMVMSFSDVSFYKAEAALEGWGATSNQAEKFYQDGVKAAMEQSPYNIKTIPAEYKELSFDGLSKEQKLEKIGTQKWIQLFGRSHEAYIEWRRMGYPVLTPGPNQGSTQGTIPRRAVYSSREALLNKANYSAAVSRLANGDSYTSRIWIDKH